MRAALLVLALAGCAPSPPSGAADGPPVREYVIDAAFTDCERADIVEAIDEWNAKRIVTPMVVVRQLAMTVEDLDQSVCLADCTFVQKGAPPGDSSGDWGTTFWYGSRGEKAIAYIRVQDRRTYVHELGHTFGLGHTDDPACIMYPLVSDVRHVTACDLAALCKVWGCAAP